MLCVNTLTYSSVRSLKGRMEFWIVFPNFKSARVGDPCEVHLSSKLGVNLLREKNPPSQVEVARLIAEVGLPQWH